VDGNNSPSGDGIMYECGNKAHAYVTSGLVEDVDAIHQGNGCFGGWGVSGLIFRNCRAARTHCGGWAGRAKPSSGALVVSERHETRTRTRTRTHTRAHTANLPERLSALSPLLCAMSRMSAPSSSAGGGVLCTLMQFAGGTEGGQDGQPSSGLEIVNGSFFGLCRQNLVWPGTAFSKRELAQRAFTARKPLRLRFCFLGGSGRGGGSSAQQQQQQQQHRKGGGTPAHQQSGGGWVVAGS
jgi:hypothetical protein